MAIPEHKAEKAHLVEEQPIALDYHKLLLFTKVCKINILMIGLGRVQGAQTHSACHIDQEHGVH